MGGITWPNATDHYPDLVVREKVHIYTARYFVFFDFYNFFLHDVLVSHRHIPAHQYFHPWIPHTWDRSAADIGHSCPPTGHTSPARTVN